MITISFGLIRDVRIEFKFSHRIAIILKLLKKSFVAEYDHI